MGFFSHLHSIVRNDFLSPTGYFFIGWVFLYLLIAIFASYREQRREGMSFSFRRAIKFCFPREVYSGPSAKYDYKIFLLCHYLISYPLGLLVFLDESWLANKIAPHVAQGILFLGKFTLPVSNGFWVDFIFTILIVAAADLGWTFQHWLFHRVPRLWEFHKVHHSATQLNIFTIGRVHPFDIMTQTLFGGVTAAIFLGLCKAFLGYSPSLVLFMNVSWVLAAWRLFAIFRHSHIWLSYGPHLSRLLSSPAMHHIHHSVEESHSNKNFAFVFSFWDSLFGTLYIPKQRENLKFGLSAQEPDSHVLLGSLIAPFLRKKRVQVFVGGSESRTSKK